LLLSSYLSSLIVGCCLHVWPIFSSMMPCFGDWLSDSVLASFQSTSTFFICGFLSCYLVGFVLLFLYLKGLVCAKCLLKLSCCRTLCSFLRGQVVICSQHSYIMWLSKLAPGTAKPPKRLEEVLPMGPRLATDGGPPCLSLVPYPERATS
jgi:hypothetical protein